MRLSTYICAVIAPVTTLVFVHSGCCYAQHPRDTGVILQRNKETGSEVISNEWQSSRYVRSQPKSLCEGNSTSCDLKSRIGFRLWNGVANRVVGGTAAKLEEFPFMASLVKEQRHFCSMCIITRSWLISAGHCTIFIRAEGIFSDPSDYYVIAGSPLLIVNMTKGCIKDELRRDVDRLVRHPEFRESVLQKDLVLVHVSRPLTFSDRIQAAPLPTAALSTRTQLRTGLPCTVPGWGAVYIPSSKASPPLRTLIKDACLMNVSAHVVLELQQVTLPVMSVKRCMEKYPWAQNWLLEDGHICTTPVDGKDACVGDSGAPLICNTTVVGLVSWGLGCAEEKFPTVYTRIDMDLDWILATTSQRKASLASPPPNIIVAVFLGHLAAALASVLR